MLEEFNLGWNVAQCGASGGPEALFSNIDHIVQLSLLSLGCVHGISLTRGCEDLLDTLL